MAHQEYGFQVENKYLKEEEVPALYYGQGSFYNYDTNKYVTFEPLKSGSFTMELYELKSFGDSIYYTGEMKDGQLVYRDQEENEVLKSQLNGRRPRVTDEERRRLALKGKALGQNALAFFRAGSGAFRARGCR